VGCVIGTYERAPKDVEEVEDSDEVAALDAVAV
jgi:hypothetical protein